MIVLIPTIGRKLPARCLSSSAYLGAVAAACLLSMGCSNAKWLNNKGIALYRQGHYDYALTAFQQAQAQDTENPNVYYNIARVYHHQGMQNNDKAKMEQAESHYHQCLNRDPDGTHRDCYRGLAVLLMETDRSESAFTLMKGWSARHPNLAAPKIELARLYEEHGDLDSAKERLLEAISIEPNNPRALAALGKVREQKAGRLATEGRHDEKERELAQAMSNYRRSLQADRRQIEVANRVAMLQATHPQLNSRINSADGRRLVNGSGTRSRTVISPRL